MPLLDWLNKNQALRTAGRVPFRLLETVSAHCMVILDLVPTEIAETTCCRRARY